MLFNVIIRQIGISLSISRFSRNLPVENAYYNLKLNNENNPWFHTPNSIYFIHKYTLKNIYFYYLRNFDTNLHFQILLQNVVKLTLNKTKLNFKIKVANENLVNKSISKCVLEPLKNVLQLAILYSNILLL